MAEAFQKLMYYMTPGDAGLLAIGLPDVPAYRRILAKMNRGRHRLGVTLVFVAEDGRLDVWNPAEYLPGS